jgi:hypothetical protein
VRNVNSKEIDTERERDNLLAGSRVPMINTSVSACCATVRLDEKGFILVNIDDAAFCFMSTLRAGHYA